MRLLLLACRLFTGAVFLWATATKLPDMATFAQDVANYRLLPAPLVPAAAAILVGVEALVGALLLLGIRARAAGLLAALLLAAFVAGLAQALLRGIDLNCGCFGGAERATWWTVVRDLGFLLPAAAVALRGGGSLRPPAPGASA